MPLTLYHGSDHRIERPLYGVGKPYNDYGLGFYCTEERSMAMEWAVERGRDGFVNAYELDLEGLDVLDLNDGSLCILSWLAVLLENREFDIPSALALESREYLLRRFLPDYRGRDVIVGYRADDSYFSFAQDFINGTISVRQLGRAMHLGRLGEQVVVKSPQAFDRLVFKGAELADASTWYPRKRRRDLNARHEYLDSERNRRERGGLYMPQIIDEEVGPDDPRLR